MSLKSIVNRFKKLFSKQNIAISIIDPIVVSNLRIGNLFHSSDGRVIVIDNVESVFVTDKFPTSIKYTGSSFYKNRKRFIMTTGLITPIELSFTLLSMCNFSIRNDETLIGIGEIARNDFYFLLDSYSVSLKNGICVFCKRILVEGVFVHVELEKIKFLHELQNTFFKYENKEIELNLKTICNVIKKNN